MCLLRTAIPFYRATALIRVGPICAAPDFDGVSREINLADSWPSEGPPVLWVKELGRGYSSIVVQDDRAYTQYQSSAGQFVICLDASTGHTIWQYWYDWPFEASGLYPGPRSTPTLAMDHVYFSTPAGAVGCLNRSGKLVWQQDLKKTFNGKGTDFGYACSPTVIHGKVIMPVGGQGASMVALDASDGSLLWKSGNASASYTPALPITVNGHQQVIGYMQHALVAFDLETGRLLWQYRISRGYDEHSAWPIYNDSHLWTSAPFQAGSQLLKLSSGEDPSYELVWESRLMSNDVASSILLNGHLYGFDLSEVQSKAHRPSRGRFQCMNLLSGDVKWSNGDPDVRRERDSPKNWDSPKSTEQQAIGQASGIAADGKLILFNDVGSLILAEINSQRYVELARTPVLVDEICWTTPALDRGRVFVRDHHRVVCLYVGVPELRSVETIARSIRVDEIPKGRLVSLSSLLGVEPKYTMIPPTRRWLQQWLFVSIAILIMAGLCASLLGLIRKSSQVIRGCFYGIAMTLGVVVGPIASVLTDDFVFTWPVVLFIAFEIAVYRSTLHRFKTSNSRSRRLQDLTIAVMFVTICGAYFLLCQRLSLVTQWLFLCGFSTACPVVLVGRRFSQRPGRWNLLAEFGLTLIAYTAFHYGTVLVLSFQYQLSDF